MDPFSLKRKLILKAKEIGIDKIGFTSAKPFYYLFQKLILRNLKGYSTCFEDKSIVRRIFPRTSLKNARTIIAIALAYPSKLPHPPVSKKGFYRGIFCRSSWGKDYHLVLEQKLNLLKDYLLSFFKDCKTKIMVDTGPLVDRAIAIRAGIGFSGKNACVITKEFGSFVYLGQLLTDVYLPEDKPIKEDCGSCRLCLDACPTGAIVKPGVIDAKKCISYLTQTKDLIPKGYREKLGNRLYGCDTCQIVCPKNKGLNSTHQRDFLPEAFKVKPLLKPLLRLSNKKFRRIFGSMAGAWRGRTPIQRNAIIALAHFKDKSALPLLFSLLKDKREVIRGTSAWALGKIGDKSSIAYLKEALKVEESLKVRLEILHSLKMLQK